MKQNNSHIPPDDSLHSFLFRLLKVHGFNDYSALFAKNKGWRQLPSLPVEAIPLIQNVDKSILLELYERSLEIPEYECHVEHCFIHIDNFHRNILSDEPRVNNSSKGIKIRFCQHCIKEQITDYGFAYFKVGWLFENRCSRHNVALSHIPETTVLQLARHVNDVLRGKGSEYETCMKPLKSYRTCNNRSVKFCPCAQDLIVKWALKKEDFSPFGFSELLPYKFLSGTQHCAFRVLGLHREIKNNWSSVYEQLAEYHYEELIKLIDTSMVYDEAIYCNSGLQSERKPIFKAKNKQCNLCLFNSPQMYKICPNNDIINVKNVTLSQDQELGYYSSHTPCESWFFDTKSALHEHHKKGNLHKRALEVEREIELQEVYRRAGGKDAYLQKMILAMESLDI